MDRTVFFFFLVFFIHFFFFHDSVIPSRVCHQAFNPVLVVSTVSVARYDLFGCRRDLAGCRVERLVDQFPVRCVRRIHPAGFVRDPLRPTGSDLREQCRGRIGFTPLPRDFGVLVLVFCVTGRAARLLDGRLDHRDDGVVGYAPLARTIIVQNVTKPKLALLHLLSRRATGGG